MHDGEGQYASAKFNTRLCFNLTGEIKLTSQFIRPHRFLRKTIILRRSIGKPEFLRLGSKA